MAGPGQPNMQQLMKQAQKMQAQLMEAQAKLADTEVSGSAGGGLVTAVVTGSGDVVSIKIDPKAVDADDVESLEDLVVAAIRDAAPTRRSCSRRRWARSPAGWAASACPGCSRRMYEGAVQDLIDELGRLPGVGPKSAQRIAFHLLAADPADVRRLVTALTEVKDKVRFCRICGNVSEQDECRVCRDPRRDLSVICVVEESKDVVAIEKTREFRGRYHVLGGAISPIEGIGPDDLRVRELMVRLQDGGVTELILATDPNLEGEATATYLARLIGPMGLRVTRLASGLPVGGDLEYADEVTLGRAFEGRRQVDV
jgi:recombination protein RecR